jgi:catechol 2,3-dioxygenase-like lactoylglutathione lyase family enzyme
VSHLSLISLIVPDYDTAIDFFVRVLEFELAEDVPSTTNDGRPKRWVVVKPKGGETGILLARADGDAQQHAVGHQFAGRVGLFLRVDDFDATYARLQDAGVTFVNAPRTEAYGRVVVFQDIFGNKWDLLGPAADVPRLEAVHPVLMSRDMPRSIRFYTSIGFTLAGQDATGDPKYAVLRRDDVELHVQWHDASEWNFPNDRPTYRFIVRHVDAFHRYCAAQLAQPDMTAVWDTAWGTREFHLRDPDLNGLQFYAPLGSPVRTLTQ